MTRYLLAVLCALTIISQASAKQVRLHGHFICGLVQRLHFGLPPRFNLALEWATLPHTNPHPGAVVVQRRHGHALGGGPGGHVSRIVSLRDTCRATVTDDKGTYERDICKNLVAYVDPRH